MSSRWIRCSVWSAAAVALGMEIGAAAAGGQTIAATPAEVLAKVQARYRSGPTCERMRIELRTDAGRVARSWAVVRMLPTERGPELLLELGSLRIACDGKTITAVHERNAQTCFAVPLPGEGEVTADRLQQVLPPIPLYQLDLAAGAPGGPLTTYAPHVRWESASVEQKGPVRFTLVGVSDAGKVLMQVRGDQVQSMELRDDARGATIKLQVTPELPCRAEDMALSVADRSKVDRLSDLQPRSGVLRIGSPVPEMPLSTSAGQVQRLKELFTPPPEYLPAPDAERLVIVFTRRNKPEWRAPLKFGRVEAAVVGKELRRLQREAYAGADHGLEPAMTPGQLDRDAPLLPTFNYAQVMVLETPPPADELLMLIKKEREVWGSGAAGLGEHLAWTTEPKSSVELFTPEAESSAIVLGLTEQGPVLRSVIPIRDRMTTEELIDQVTAALLETGE